MSCDVVVTNPDGTSVSIADGFTYDESLNTFVSSISPVRGGTAGGTHITISGTGFGYGQLDLARESLMLE